MVADPGDPFGRYYAEILRAEGLNAFAVGDPGALTPAGLAPYQVVVLARTGVNDAQLGALGAWVNGGGDLIAMRPEPRLAGLLGLGADTGDLAEGYIKAEAGAGITGETMQFHGTADVWTLAGASTVASLYSGPAGATGAPAVTLRSAGAGQAAVFAYDLARSVVFTRQGNPAWVNQKRDGTPGPHRSDDLFVPEGTTPGWVNLDKVRIPQADEQQRLLANLITGMARDRMPLPRFWYLPRGLRAAVVMTGDDHSSNVAGTQTHLNRFDQLSFAGCSVADWQCVRATSYVYPGAQVAGLAAYQNRGHEIALHLDTGCQNYSAAALAAFWDSQRPAFLQSGLAAPRTNRTHCIAWSDWVTQPQVERNYGVRLDTNYYYYPAAVGARPPGHVHRVRLPDALRRRQRLDRRRLSGRDADDRRVRDLVRPARAGADRRCPRPRGLLRRLHGEHPHGPRRRAGRADHRRGAGQGRPGHLRRAAARLDRRPRRVRVPRSALRRRAADLQAGSRRRRARARGHAPRRRAHRAVARRRAGDPRRRATSRASTTARSTPRRARTRRRTALVRRSSCRRPRRRRGTGPSPASASGRERSA